MSDTTLSAKPRRSGGRAARHAKRAAVPPSDLRPIRPGLTGGQYNPLQQADMPRIYAAALQVLDEIGLADAPESGVQAMVSVGAVLGEDGRLRFPGKVVEAALAACATRHHALWAHPAPRSATYGGTRLLWNRRSRCSLGGWDHGSLPRDSTAADLRDAAHITDVLDNVHFFQRPMVCREVTDNRLLDLTTIYACATGTTKHIGTSFVNEDHVRDAAPMLHAIAGSEEAWRARPFVLQSNCFVVPPLKFATESCEAMEAAIEIGMPVLLLSAGQAGATAPVTLAGRCGASGRRMLGRVGLCECHQTGPHRRCGHLAVRERPPHRRDVRWLRRAGAADRCLRSNAPLFGSLWRRGGGHR